jgi:hypothetical protein
MGAMGTRLYLQGFSFDPAVRGQWDQWEQAQGGSLSLIPLPCGWDQMRAKMGSAQLAQIQVGAIVDPIDPTENT